jgi:hypothetical protein
MSPRSGVVGWRSRAAPVPSNKDANRFEHAVDARGVARGAFDLHDAADVGKDGVRAGVNWRFGGWAGPVIAKY